MRHAGLHRGSNGIVRGLARGFTLVELLVVIGIIGVLMSLLVPMAAQMWDRAKSTKCSSNLSQMGKAWYMYANQYKICTPGRMAQLSDPNAGAYGLGDGFDQYRPRWYELLGAQVGQFASKTPHNYEDDTWTISNEWFLCAAVPDWTNSRNYPYGYNHQFLGNARKRKTAPPSGSGSSEKDWVNYPVPFSRVSASSETVMIADSLGTAVSVPTVERKGYYVNGKKDPDAVGNKAFLLDAPRQTSVSDRADVQIDATYHSGPAARHMKKVNVAFVDGHVSLMTIEEMGYVVNADGSIPLSGTVNGRTATNRIFSGQNRDDDAPAAN